MAERPVFLPMNHGDLFVKTVKVEFQWFPGLAISQKQKSIASLHEAAINKGLCTDPIEISSRSSVGTGVALSAFNLGVKSPKSGRTFSVETAFQSSKVFENGGPYRDLLYATSREAKKDPRIQESGRLLAFVFFGTNWELEPKTAFYDWLYINALSKNSDLMDDVRPYDGFSDIEFNPEKSINCQAYSLALFKALKARNLLLEALASKEAFLEVSGYKVVNNAREDTSVQQLLV